MNTAVASGNDRLLLAVLVASALHVLVIFGITFDALRSEQRPRQVEVTLIQTPSKAPQEAEHIAQADQQGSGSEAQRDYSTGSPSTLPRPQDSADANTRTSRGKERLASPAVTSLESNQRIVDRRGQKPEQEDLPATERELARLNEELARLQANLDSQQTSGTSRPRVRRLDAVSARAAVDAAYLAEWRQRVEEVGNQYYPEASLRYGIYGSLSMLVTIRSNGQLEDIRILKPSGHAVLDEAAIRIVRMAAPFPPFPKELRATTDKLEIVRTWQFEQNPLSSN
jgi:protein TonB